MLRARRYRRVFIRHGLRGDSRAYLLRNDEISLLTQDHSLVNELLATGSITAEEAENHPRRNILTKALGVVPEQEPDIIEIKVFPDDMLLLCTDGFYQYFQEEEIAGMLSESSISLETKVETMIQLALTRGGNDNITVVLAVNK